MSDRALQGGSDLGYIMRAYHTVAPIGYVYWRAETDVPDTSATFAPYPLADLTNIMVVRGFVPLVISG